MNTISYEIGDKLYLNITNACTNACDFCIRTKTSKLNNQYDLWLDHEPSLDEIISSIKDPQKYSEVVFCGYGEPLLRLPIVKEVAEYLKEKGCRVRLDTNGQANIIHKRNVVPELKGLIDAVSISLNAQDPTVYNAICHSNFGRAAYDAMLDFARECKKIIPYVQLSVVELPAVDIEACKRIASELGLPLKIRAYYEEDYAGYK